MSSASFNANSRRSKHFKLLKTQSPRLPTFVTEVCATPANPSRVGTEGAQVIGTIAGGFFLVSINLGNSICMTYGAEDVQEQRSRVAYMEMLYQADLRYMKEHPYHGRFCGLYDLYKNHGTYGRNQSA